MVFNTGAALLDAIVLAVVSEEKEGTYGYKITQEVRVVLDVSESTLYPVLRRLLKDGCLEVYDMEYEEGTAGIIRSRRAAAASSIFILPSGRNIPKELPVSLQGGKNHDKTGVSGEARRSFAGHSGRGEGGGSGVLQGIF